MMLRFPPSKPRCRSSDIDGVVIVLLGRMMILYNSGWAVFKIIALSAPYSTIFLTPSGSTSNSILATVVTTAAPTPRSTSLLGTTLLATTLPGAAL
jgi:hypothetical protein